MYLYVVFEFVLFVYYYLQPRILFNNILLHLYNPTIILLFLYLILMNKFLYKILLKRFR